MKRLLVILAACFCTAAQAQTYPNRPIEVATTVELNYPNVNSDNWYGLVAAAATPPGVQRRIQAAAVAALKSELHRHRAGEVVEDCAGHRLQGIMREEEEAP